MKIVCLIVPTPHTIHFVNCLHDRFPVALVVLEEANQRRDPMVRRLSRMASPRTGLAAIHDRMRAGERTRLNREILGASALALNPQIELLRVTSVNAPEVHARLSAEKPDVIADHGTSIVREPVIATAQAALNLHWGLSPYYRGVRCTEWALINWDPFNIGVTIHELTLNIDGGPIWAQERADISPSDVVHGVNMQLTRRGTGLAIRAIASIAAGKAPPPQPQRREIGYLTLSRQWTRHLSSQIRHIEREGLIARMLKNPARAALPIVELPA